MNELNKDKEYLPLKQAEVSVKRFNDIAIPHHLELLKNHQINIEKSLPLGDWSKVKKEQTNAMRVIRQIKNLLLEMDELRDRLQPTDLTHFDAMMKIGKEKAFAGMKQYMEVQLNSNTLNRRNSEDEETMPDLTQHQTVLPAIQTNFTQQEYQITQRQACLDEILILQHEINDLNGMFLNVHDLVHEQAESVTAVAENCEEALENVQTGEQNLRKALSYKKVMYPVVGALLGTCVGGPIGLVAGLKAGGLTAVGCGILGYTGGSVLKGNPTIVNGNIEEIQLQSEDDKAEEIKTE